MKTVVLLRPAEGATIEEISAVVPEEEPVLWRYMASGELRASYYDAATPGGVVIEFETESPARVVELVEAFPLVKAGLLEPEYHPLVPYTGLSVLFDPAHGFHPVLPESWTRLD